MNYGKGWWIKDNIEEIYVKKVFRKELLQDEKDLRLNLPPNN